MNQAAAAVTIRSLLLRPAANNIDYSDLFFFFLRKIRTISSAAAAAGKTAISQGMR